MATLVLTGLTLIGLAAAGVTTLLDSAAQQAYLDRHAREVRLALARGQGTFVLDVGHNLGIGTGEVSHLGDVLREARPKLEPLLKDAKGFAAELVRTLLADPALAPRTQALMQMIEQKS
ncbi:MAG: hypothetical protein U1F43_10760 [Myxococcota bacterium]